MNSHYKPSSMRKHSKDCARFYLQHATTILSRESDFESPYSNPRTKRTYDDEIDYDDDYYEEEDFYPDPIVPGEMEERTISYPEVECKDPGCD